MGWAAARAEPLRNASGRFWLSSDPFGIRRDRSGRPRKSPRATPFAPITERVAPVGAPSHYGLAVAGRAQPVRQQSREHGRQERPEEQPGWTGAARDQAERGD